MDKFNEVDKQNVLAKIEEFSENYRTIGRQLHELIMTSAPQLQPRLWYGMPGYALKSNGPVVLFFREDKYISFGITENANIDKLGQPRKDLIGSAWYLTGFSDESKAKITHIVQKITTK